MMQRVVPGENNQWENWLVILLSLYLFHVRNKNIFWFLFLLLLFCKEAGNDFVEKIASN
jgi:hypothetical protein